MIELRKEDEAIPASYPAATAPDGVDAAAVWQRIEAYTRTRYTDRAVTWTLEGDTGDDWNPPLSPVTAIQAERWDGDAFVPVGLSDGPLGHSLPMRGTYRVTAQVGSGDAPAAVLEAFRRLATYLADDDDRAGVSSYSVNMGGAIQESYSRNAAHTARALQNSGAADLLRPYRRLK
ncbi:MAG: hypothetical protein WBA35_07555 [Litorimonas sp.]